MIRMKVLQLRLRMFLLLTGVYAMVAMLSMLLFWLLTPAQYFGVYPLLDVFYWMCGMAMTFFLDRVRCTSARADKLLSVFMIFRGTKFLLTIIALAVGVKLIGLDPVTFAISLMCNYLVYSILEIYVYHRYNKKITTCKWH